MASEPGHERRTRDSRIIKAPRRAVYRAFLDPAAVVSWLPPKGMTGRIDAIDPREGGVYRLTLIYDATDGVPRGKTSDHTDVVRGPFQELIPDTRIVQRVEFESTDPAYAGAMTIIWTLVDVPGGTEVAILCENVPPAYNRAITRRACGRHSRTSRPSRSDGPRPRFRLIQ
jgi:uncharacterized protein YndB with AHSA1/START domain